MSEKLTETELLMLKAHFQRQSLDDHLRGQLVKRGYLFDHHITSTDRERHLSYSLTEEGRKALEAADR